MIGLDPVWGELAQASIHRRLLEAFAAPGRVVELDVSCGGATAQTAVLATLVDHAVSLADPQHLLDTGVRELLGAPQAPVLEADFVLMPGHEPPPAGFACRLGGLLTPERGATLLLSVPVLPDEGDGPGCHGPGVMPGTVLRCVGLHPAWLLWRGALHRLLPDGIDIMLTAGRRLVALPRSTAIDGER
jgi:alpha-D-ribose 1-methylphosphonate 5-triphosphate synthase subunit PhnH